jgi:hypothetical protein
LSDPLPWQHCPFRVLEVDHVVSGFADKLTVYEVTPAQELHDCAEIREIKLQQIIPQNKIRRHAMKTRFISINSY